MISVQMGNENMMDLPKPDAISSELHLGAFSTIDQKKPLIRI
jgi:hypothetical protein